MAKFSKLHVIEENRKLHNFGAKNYDNYPPYLLRKQRSVFRRDLDKFPNNYLTALDCGGGTGELGRILFSKGYGVTLLDISEEMLNVAKKKIPKGKFICAEIETYLRETDDKYDLICFTGTLHHLYDYMTVIKLAIRCLKPGGGLYIVDGVKDKISKPHFSDSLSAHMCNGYKCLRNPFHAISFLFNRKNINMNLAEFHAREGIDLEEILVFLAENGFIINFEFFSLPYFKIFERKDKPGDLFRLCCWKKSCVSEKSKSL